MQAQKEFSQPITSQESYYQSLFEFAPDAYLITDGAGVIKQANQVAMTLLSASPAQLVDHSLCDYLAREDHPVFQALLRQVERVERVQNKEMCVQPITGTPFDVAATVAILPGQANSTEVMLGWLIRDITKHKALEEIWRQYEFIANTSKDLLMLIDAGYRYEAVNDAFCLAHAKARGDILNHPVADILGQDHYMAQVKPHLDRCFAGEEVRLESYVYLSTIGERYFDVTYYPYANAEDRVTHAVVVSRDVTERKLAEDALQQAHEALETRVIERTAALSRMNLDLEQQIIEREKMQLALLSSEERYKRLLEAVTDYIYSVTVEAGRPVRTMHSPACQAVTGYTSEEYEANPDLWYQMVHPDDREMALAQVEQVLSGQQSASLEHRIIHKDGTVRWIRNTPVPRYDDDGCLIAYDGLITDVTTRKQVEEERERLLAAEREQRLMAETLGEVFLALTSQINHEAVLDEILQQARRLVSFRAANIVLLEQGKLHTAHWQGYENAVSTSLFATLQQHLTDFPLDAKVIQTRQPLVLPDVRQIADWVVVEALDWIRSFIAVPICLQDRVLGLLRLDGDIAHQFTADDVKRLQPLANAAAIALENARLYEQLQQDLVERIALEEQAFELNRKFLALQYAGATITSNLDLRSVLDTFTRELVGLLDVEGCIISEWDEANDKISVIARHGPAQWWPERSLHTTYDTRDIPLIQWVLTERHAQHLVISQPDLDPNDLAYLQAGHIKTLLILPMKFKSRVVGLVEVMDDQVELDFHADEIALAQLMANQAANALENARLYSQAQQEITERKRAEQELRRSETRNRALLDAIPDLMFHLTREGLYLDYKAGDSDELYVSPEMFLGRSIQEILPSDVSSMLLDCIDKTLVTGKMQVLEYHLPLAKGSQDYEARLVASGENEVLAIVRNITESKRNKAALERSEANLKAIFDNSLQVFLLIDQDYRIQAFNRTAQVGIRRLFGKIIHEDSLVADFVPADVFVQVEGFLSRALNGESVTFEQHLNMNNIDQWFEYHFDPVFAAENSVIGVCFSTVDISERKKTADALAESEARLLAEMQSVLAITRALVSQINVNSLLEFIVAQAEHLTNAEGAAVLLLSEDGRWLEVATADEVWSGMSAGLRLLAEGSLAELALASQRVQVSNRAQDDGRTASIRALLESVSLHTLLCAPLKAQGRNLGVLLIWNKRKQLFTDHDNRLMGLFADQAALAWYNADLHTKNRELAIEQERHRLARELHDSVTQSLYSIGMAAQASLRILGETNSGVYEPIKHIQRLSQTALTEMREQLHNLRPSMLANKGLVEVLDQYCDGLSEQYGLDIEFVARFQPALSMYQQESLYYIAREALSNVVKYADAMRVRVVLGQENDQVVLTVLDEGTGFPPSVLKESETMGLRGMGERAKLLGGNLELHSEPGQGTQVTVRIPIKLPDNHAH